MGATRNVGGPVYCACCSDSPDRAVTDLFRFAGTAQPITNSPQLSETDMQHAFKAIAHRSASRTFTTGAPVIYMKNLPEEYLVNGSRGQIIGFAVDGAWGEDAYQPAMHLARRADILRLSLWGTFGIDSDRTRPEDTLLPEDTAAQRVAISRNPDAYPVVRFTDVRMETTFVHITPVKFSCDNPNGTVKCVASMVPLLRESRSSVMSPSRELRDAHQRRYSCLGYLYAQVAGPK